MLNEIRRVEGASALDGVSALGGIFPEARLFMLREAEVVGTGLKGCASCLAFKGAC